MVFPIRDLNQSELCLLLMCLGVHHMLAYTLHNFSCCLFTHIGHHGFFYIIIFNYFLEVIFVFLFMKVKYKCVIQEGPFRYNMEYAYSHYINQLEWSNCIKDSVNMEHIQLLMVLHDLLCIFPVLYHLLCIILHSSLFSLLCLFWVD